MKEKRLWQIESMILNKMLFGVSSPSPLEKSIRRQYKNKKLKKKLDKMIDKYSKQP